VLFSLHLKEAEYMLSCLSCDGDIFSLFGRQTLPVLDFFGISNTRQVQHIPGIFRIFGLSNLNNADLPKWHHSAAYSPSKSTQV